MFEKVKRFFGRPQSEEIYELIRQSEQRPVGWYRQLDSLDRFLGYFWACPGKILEKDPAEDEAAMPAPGKKPKKKAEAKIAFRMSCSFVSGAITPDEDGIKNVFAKCPQCGVESSLETYVAERGISVRQLPVRKRSRSPVTQPRFLNTWNQSGAGDDGGFRYEPAGPPGIWGGR